jgi:hypothetical protein
LFDESISRKVKLTHLTSFIMKATAGELRIEKVLKLSKRYQAM